MAVRTEHGAATSLSGKGGVVRLEALHPSRQKVLGPLLGPTQQVSLGIVLLFTQEDLEHVVCCFVCVCLGRENKREESQRRGDHRTKLHKEESPLGLRKTQCERTTSLPALVTPAAARFMLALEA